MKKIFTLFVSLVIVAGAYGQTCRPDSSIIGAAFPVQPLPYDPTASPDGGIRDTACLDNYFEFTFSAALGETFTISGIPLALDSIRLPKTGGIGNLPNGISYNCDPGDCVFVKNSLGCILLYGTITDPAMIGEHNLTISVELFANGSTTGQVINLPIPTVTPGNYTLAVRDSDFSNCAVVGAYEPLESLVSMQNIPNPFSDITTIRVNSYVTSEVYFEVVNAMGQQIHLEKISLTEGTNTVLFDGSQLAEGMYFYSLKNELGAVTGKMQIVK